MHRSQTGAALVYGLFVLMGGAAALWYLFNTGQLVREKTQLVNTADAVAYSAGIMQARTLNYLAYTNRSVIANEVLVAQALSLHAWSQYLVSWNQRVAGVHPECRSGQPGAMVAGMAFKYDPEYALACWMAAHGGSLFQGHEAFQRHGVGIALEAIRVSQQALQLSQTLAVQGLSWSSAVPGAMASTLQGIAQANFPQDPSGIRVVAGREALLPDDWLGFVSQYPQQQRQRLKDLVVQAADDGHLKARQRTSRALLPVLCGWGLRHQEVRRRGGTELLGFDEWHAADTQAFQRYWTRWRWSGPSCQSAQVPTAWAAREVHTQDVPDGQGSYGRARADTASTLRLAQGSAKTTSRQYAGLPTVHDLSSTQRALADPVLRLGIRVERDRQRLRVTDGQAQVGQGIGRLSPFITRAPSSGRGEALHAVAVSEVYYRQPDRSRQAELGSLFQPHWHVRLVPADPLQAWAALGVIAPPRP
jgi:hypothetical protein